MNVIIIVGLVVFLLGLAAVAERDEGGGCGRLASLFAGIVLLALVVRFVKLVWYL